MERAARAGAAGERRGVFDVDEERVIEALRLAWGEAYDIGFADGAWRALRLDGHGLLVTGQTPDELNAAIRADFTRERTP
jgi:hypothetical protein